MGCEESGIDGRFQIHGRTLTATASNFRLVPLRSGCNISRSEVTMSDSKPGPVLVKNRSVSLFDAVRSLELAGKQYARLFVHGSATIEIYAPRGKDDQTPHERDELYVIASGSGTFVNGEQRMSFSKGDVLFAAAGEEHRFEDFSDDFYTWVIFYGPHGGEKHEGPSLVQKSPATEPTLK
jgi:mannose-6-phosphate isomerase-like protein (cupin superfamily)